MLVGGHCLSQLTMLSPDHDGNLCLLRKEDPLWTVSRVGRGGSGMIEGVESPGPENINISE